MWILCKDHFTVATIVPRSWRKSEWENCSLVDSGDNVKSLSRAATIWRAIRAAVTEYPDVHAARINKTARSGLAKACKFAQYAWGMTRFLITVPKRIWITSRVCLGRYKNPVTVGLLKRASGLSKRKSESFLTPRSPLRSMFRLWFEPFMFRSRHWRRGNSR